MPSVDARTAGAQPRAFPRWSCVPHDLEHGTAIARGCGMRIDACCLLYEDDLDGRQGSCFFWYRAHLHALRATTDRGTRKRNEKVASTSRLRLLSGASLDMAWVVRFAHQPHLVEEGEKTGACTRTTRCTNAHPRSCHRVPRFSLAAPRDGHLCPIVPPLLAACTHRSFRQGCTATFLLRSHSVSESWTGIGVVAGCAAVMLITPGPHVKDIAAHWRITVLHILQEGRGVCKTRNPLKLRDACLRAACALWPGLA